MAQDRPRATGQPLHTWLPGVVLRFLVFGALAFVLYEVTLGLGEQELGSGRAWVLVATMLSLLLLLAIDRLTGLRFSPGGVEATLAQAQVQALEQVRDLEDRRAAQAAESQIMQAHSADQVETALAMAVELNLARIVDRVREAIRQKRKLYVRYRADPKGPFATFQVAPLDIKPGRTPATQANDYLWVHSYEHGHVLSMRLGQVLGVELSEETFEPADVMAGWKERSPQWNIPRDWPAELAEPR